MERLHRREFLDALAGALASEAPGGVYIGPNPAISTGWCGDPKPQTPVPVT
jgi:hypothetical protein